MRDRLIELLTKAKKEYANDVTDLSEIRYVAECLLADGWIRPPCKVGDKVYFVARNCGIPIGTIDEVEIVMIGRTQSDFCAKGKIVSVSDNTFDIIPKFEIDNYTFYSSRE